MRYGGREHGSAPSDQVRRLRDLLRAGVLAGRYAGLHLPSEAELMAAHGVSRAVVRAALGMLRSEGLIERTQGIGTTSMAKVNDALLLEAHGQSVETGRRAVLEEVRPHIVDRSMIPMPPDVAAALDMTAGAPCLRLEYVSLINDEPVAMATNYVRPPEAEAIAGAPFTADWYRLLRAAGVAIGRSRFIMGGAPADSLVAAQLDVSPGTPLITLEQIIHDHADRPFDLAFVHIRTDRFRFVSWSESADERSTP